MLDASTSSSSIMVSLGALKSRLIKWFCLRINASVLKLGVKITIAKSLERTNICALYLLYPWMTLMVKTGSLQSKFVVSKTIAVMSFSFKNYII